MLKAKCRDCGSTDIQVGEPKALRGERYFEYDGWDGQPQKFWGIRKEGHKVYTRFGKYGTVGTTTINQFQWDGDARRYMNNKIDEKENKGYNERT